MPVIPPYPEGHRLLAGKSVLVTAAAGAGIGYATAKRALEEGCRGLFIADMHAERTQRAVASLREETGCSHVFGLVADVTREEDVQRLIASAEAALDGVDVLINNAGLGGTCSVAAMSDAEWNRVIDVSLTGTFRMTRAMLKKMQPRGRGAIVNSASVLGWRAAREQAHYAAAKAGVMALTRCSAMEAAEHGIRINAVAPSIAMHAFLQKTSSQQLLDELAAREAFGRAAEVWEVANVSIFLASDYASYLTGEVISVSSQHP